MNPPYFWGFRDFWTFTTFTNFVTPNFITPNLIALNLVTPNLVTSNLITPNLITPTQKKILKRIRKLSSVKFQSQCKSTDTSLGRDTV